MIHRIASLCIVFSLLASCQEAVIVEKIISAASENKAGEEAEELKSKQPKQITDGTVTISNDASNTTSEIVMKDGKKNGVARQFYSSGKVWKESPYLNDNLHGVAKVYDEEGRLQREVNYHTGLKHGDYIEYFKSGNIKVKVSYTYDLPQPGVEEVDFKGEAIPAATISVKESDMLKTEGAFHYHFELNQKYKEVNFYVLQEHEEWSGKNTKLREALLPTEKGIGHLMLPLKKGYEIKTNLYIYAVYTSKLGVRAAAKKKLKVALRH